ncbi:hypothetical protein QFC22_005595 [Naganishia vaughanmartiniae]|uniref:Uncharacterized protein n=1 Tax=Naganishia vaughanmartiniae TaxID=1424756 RepID=A0ACC2WUA8_9TREE|nr:hypothetical protein QFC22_005595 [Naganishia vaughanmartiniae]
MARRRQAFNSDLSSYAESTTNQNPANRSAPNAATNAQRQPSQQQHRHHHHQPPLRAPGPVHSKVSHEVDSKTLEIPGEPVAQVIAPAVSDDDDDTDSANSEDDDEDSDERSGMAPPLPAVKDEETCFICAEKITYFAVGVCGHTTCHICAIRLRVFYKKLDCTFCKTLLPSLLFTTDAETPFPSTPPDSKLPPGTLDMSAYEFSDAKLGIVFENAEMMEATLLLLRFNCPSPNCSFMAAGWDGLEKHTLAVHGSILWQVLSLLSYYPAISTLTTIPPEQPSMSTTTLPIRTRAGVVPAAFDRFARSFSVVPSFRDYLKLEAHFNHSHHPCTEQICLEKKFVVFGSEVDLKAHMVNEHGAKMNAKDRHRARQIEVGFVHFGPDDSFIPAEPTAAQRRNNQTPRTETSDQFSRVPRGGRHAAPQSQQLPQPSNDREARRAFERTLTINDDSSGSRNSKSRSQTPADATEAAVAARHAQVMDLVMSMVDYSEPKMASFRNSVRAFKNNEAGARDMIYTIYSVLNSDQESTVKIARDIVGLFNGDTEKQKSILEAVNEFKIDRRNEFPTLGDGPTGVGTEFAGIASGKILSAKRVTQPGSNSNAIWDRVERAAASAPVNRPVSTGPGGRKVPGASGSFPALGGGSKSKASGSSATPWAGRTAPPTRSGFPTLQPSAVPVAPQPRSVNFSTTSANGQKKAPKPPSAAAFPGLPSSSTGPRGLTPADRQALFGASDRAQMVSRMKGIDNTSSAGWAAGSNSGSTTPPAGSASEPAEAPQAGGKKKNKKQTLFTVSASGR